MLGHGLNERPGMKSLMSVPDTLFRMDKVTDSKMRSCGVYFNESDDRVTEMYHSISHVLFDAVLPET